MKQILRKTALMIILAACGTFAFAQSEEAIALPDVTTVVSGGALTAGKDSVPDYSPALPTVEDGRVPLPQVADSSDGVSAPEPPVDYGDTLFRVGGGVHMGFPLGDDLVSGKIALDATAELPFTDIGFDKELGGEAHLLLGGVIPQSDVSGGFAGELSVGLYLRFELEDWFCLQPSLGVGAALTHVGGSTYFDPDFLLACSVRFMPQAILDGALEFAVTPLVQIMPTADNAVCALGFRLGALYAFRN